MSSRVVLEGFDELVAELTKAPDHIRAEGMTIVREETEGCAQEMRNVYASHSKTGTLIRRVVTEFPSSTILVGMVRSKAPHSHLFEFGNQGKTRYYTGTDKRGRTYENASRGVMPAAKPEIVVPIARKRRQRMTQRLADMMRRMGFQVGDV